MPDKFFCVLLINIFYPVRCLPIPVPAVFVRMYVQVYVSFYPHAPFQGVGYALSLLPVSGTGVVSTPDRRFVV